MTIVRTFPIPGLATVQLDTRDNLRPNLQIRLDPEYRGDLNDLAQETPGPADLYLSCDHATARGNALLAKFMEVMTHWDYTGDGVPDCDEIIEAIDTALYDTDDRPKPFHRPRGGIFVRAVMAMMPPTPERHIVYSFGELKPRYRWYHFAAAIPMLLAVIGLITLQDELLPFMAYNVVTGFLAAMAAVGLSTWIGLLLFMLLTILVQRRADRHEQTVAPHTYGFFNKAAVYEEQAFREGSERWSFFEGLRSCLAFGAIHMVNLIYPLAAILPLALGGALFMAVYLRTYRRTRWRRGAVLEASVWHRVYNKVALTATAIWLVLALGQGALMLFGVFGVLLLTAKLDASHRKYREAANADRPTGAAVTGK